MLIAGMRPVLAALAVVGALACVGCSPGPEELPEVIPPAKPSTLEQEPIPQTLERALDTLDRAASGAIIIQTRQGDENVVTHLHDSLGRWIRNNWGLYDGGPLYRHLSALGLQYPDDMSGLILTSWWRRMHGRALNVEEQVRNYQHFNEQMRALRPPAPRPGRPRPDR